MPATPSPLSSPPGALARGTAGADRLPVATATHLSAWLSRAQAGGTEAVLVTGSLGSGKSTLMRIATSEARAQSFNVGEVQFPGPRLVVSEGDGDSEDIRPRVVASGLPAIREVLRLARLSADRWLLL